MDQPWQIEMFGWLRVVQADRVVSRFRTRKTGALLAYLAYYQHRSHPREVLIELLWPDCDPSAGRANLRGELPSLRRQLEPPGVPHGAVLLASGDTLQLNPAACTTDVAAFEAALAAAERTVSPAERVKYLLTAAELYRGELLPGYFEDWILLERQRLAEAFLEALHGLAALLEETGDRPRALQWARRAVAADPLCEESYHLLIRLLVADGQFEAARAQYEQGEQLLERELGSTLSPEIHALVRNLPIAKERPSPVRSGKKRQRSHASSLEQRGGPPASDADARPAADAAGVTQALEQTYGAARRTDNLPLRFTRFFGREEEIEQLRVLLLDPETRLVTLTGPGGTGKTRLALEAAQRLRDAFRGGVWFVPLQDLTDPELIADQALRSLRLSRTPQLEALEQLVMFVSREPSLLLLDSFEHLVEGGAETVRHLLEQVEHLTVLVTSRQCLRLEGEREFSVAPLPVPEEGVGCRVWSVGADKGRPAGPYTPHPTPYTLLQFPSVALFVDRAQAVKPDFQVTAKNAAAVAGICRRLEGLPLAIELAAVRVKLLPAAALLERLERRLELLTGGARDAPVRQQTLRGTIAWSYDLLHEQEQELFRRLAVFQGGCTLEAAETVCSDLGYWILDLGLPAAPEAEPSSDSAFVGPIQNPSAQRAPRIRNAAVLDLLASLVDKSLLKQEGAADGEPRFMMLETIREYGHECLAASGEETAARRGHADFYLALAEEADVKVTGPHQAAWLDRLEREYGNLRAALSWLTQASEAAKGLRLGAALWRFWEVRGYLADGRQLLARLLALPADSLESVSPEVRVKVLSVAALMADAQGDYAAARSLFEEQLVINRRSGDWRLLCESLYYTGHEALAQGDYAAARSIYEEFLTINRNLGGPMLGDRIGIAWGHKGLGDVALAQGEHAAARSLYQQCLAIFNELGLSELAVIPLNDLGHVTLAQGDYAAARSFYERSLAMFRERGNSGAVAIALNNLGDVAVAQGDYAAAWSLYEQSLALSLELGNKGGVARLLEGFMGLAAAQAQPERAVRLAGAAAALRAALRAPLSRREQPRIAHVLELARQTVSEAEASAAWAEGQAMLLEDAVNHALERGELS